MSKLQRRWPMGYQAGDLVYVRQYMAQVVECIPGIISDGCVPVVFLYQPLAAKGIVPIPADDLQRLIMPVIS